MTIRVLFVCNLASPAGAASGEREENTSCPPRWTDIAFGQPGDTKRRRLVITLTIVRRGLNLFVPFVAALTVQRIELGHVFFICMACFARGWDGFLLHHRYYYYYYFYWKPCNFHRLSHSVVIFNPLLGSHCHLEICRTATCVISIHRATWRFCILPHPGDGIFIPISLSTLSLSLSLFRSFTASIHSVCNTTRQQTIANHRAGKGFGLGFGERANKFDIITGGGGNVIKAKAGNRSSTMFEERRKGANFRNKSA